MDAERWRPLVDRALDERRDPLADEELLAHLVACPEDLADVERLLGGLAALERAPSASRCATGRPRRVAAAALLLAGLATAAWFALARSDAPAPDPGTSRTSTAALVPGSSASGASAPVAETSLGRVIAWRITSTRRDASGTQRVTSGPDARRRVHDPSRDDDRSPLAWSDTWSRPSIR